MDMDGYLWEGIDIYGYLWTAVVIYQRYEWICMDVCVYIYVYIRNICKYL